MELKNNAEDPVNIRVVNISLGGDDGDTVMNNMIAQLADAGILCVCAAGNESSTGVLMPADAPRAVSVMAIDKNGAHTFYTNYKGEGQTNTSKTVSAMGGGGTSDEDLVWSTYNINDAYYLGLSGTSQATPLVSGVAALMFAANPMLSANDARDILTSTADPVNSVGNYSYKDSSSAGMVNAYKAVSAALNMGLRTVAAPSAVGELVYTGLPQTGVTAHDGYTLSTVPYDPDQGASASSVASQEGAKETNAGHYRTTAQLTSGYQWQDGTVEDKVVAWRISPARLKVIYNGAKMMVSDSVTSVGPNISIMGFVNGESPTTLTGFKAPGLIQVVDNVGPAEADSVAISSNDFSIMSDPSVFKPLDVDVVSIPGAKILIPIAKSLADIDPENAGNPTANYEFFESQSGILDVYGRAIAPSKTDYTYDGQAKQGVRGGEHCDVTGTNTATAVGTYTAKASPNDHYIWFDKTLDDTDKDAPRTYTWKITLAKQFTDVADDSWYYGVVYRAVGLGFMSGYDDGRFGPGDNITRGQVAVILWNMANRPALEGTPKAFSDVIAGRYYYDAVRWASSAGVVNGYATGEFGPNDNVTREQLAVMLSNYASGVAGKAASGSASDYGSMKDADTVSAWAVSAVGWCFRNGILSGAGGKVLPQGNATRAETAKMVVYLHNLP